MADCGARTLAVDVARLVLVLALIGGALQAPPPPILQEPQTILLWPGRAPGALGDEDRDKPAITIYMPANTAGPLTAVVIAPGGSYRSLSMNNEGRAPANYLNSLGVAAFVLRYRLGPQYHHPIEIGPHVDEGQRAHTVAAPECRSRNAQDLREAHGPDRHAHEAAVERCGDVAGV